MLLIVYGTRPEWLKIKPILNELNKQKIDHALMCTGQHQDLIPTEGIERTDFKLDIPNVSQLGRLDSIAVGVLSQIGSFLKINKHITHIMIQGDTATALYGALAAYNNGVKIIHLEAGLRTHDLNNPYPEEANRQLISRIADIHLCPTIQNMGNLNNEHAGGVKHVVGNTALDNLLPYGLLCEYENKILVTLHRRENHENIQYWFEAINKLAGMFKDHEFILPIHPNPNV